VIAQEGGTPCGSAIIMMLVLREQRKLIPLSLQQDKNQDSRDVVPQEHASIMIIVGCVCYHQTIIISQHIIMIHELL
jgi:hypothetical protein